MSTPRVTVVGAGPAGCAAAIELARGGARVTLLERARWPRPKTCGDGVTPAAVAQLRALGVAVDERPPFASTTLVSPRERVVEAAFPARVGAGTTLERIVMDARLVDAAIAAGATFADATAVRSLDGARATTDRGTLEADAVIVADGATGGLARALGFGAHRSRLVALRGYCAVAQPLPDAYGVAYARAVLPGYAWIFPVAAYRANVGLVVTETVAKRAAGDLRAVLRAWLATSIWARGLLGEDVALEDVHGGVIPTGRAQRVLGPVFLAGDAAGTADPMTAEGVSQALACGRAAARALLDANGDVRRAGATYGATFTAVDRNAREALRMRTAFAWWAEPLLTLAAANARAARVLSAVAYTAKDESWLRAMVREAVAR